MGGSSGSTFSRRTPDELIRSVRKAEDGTTVKEFEVELGQTLGDLLGSFNGRDVELTQERLADLREALEDVIDSTIDTLFGGSVAKHTYVDGLSDIDTLMIINGSNLEKETPQKILAKFREIILKNVAPGVLVTHGKMAVTIQYSDGMIIQILPAIRANNHGILVPSSRTDAWSHINPISFQEALTRRNQECGGKLVPTIKLAKAINGELPESQRLSGYHLESLAIAAFRGYTGDKTTTAMLPAFFEKARSLVLSPIKDSTGQSVHVDGYLGAENSNERQAASHLLGRLAKRMRNATAAASVEQWKSLFGLTP